jgi:hypothetical protein
MKQFFKNNRQNNSLILKFLEIVLFCFSLLLDFKITSSSWRKKYNHTRIRIQSDPKITTNPKRTKKRSLIHIYTKN